MGLVKGAKKVEFRCRIVKRERGLMGVLVLCRMCARHLLMGNKE